MCVDLDLYYSSNKSMMQIKWVNSNFFYVFGVNEETWVLNYNIPQKFDLIINYVDFLVIFSSIFHI